MSSGSAPERILALQGRRWDGAHARAGAFGCGLGGPRWRTLPGAYELGHRAHRVFDRDVRVERDAGSRDRCVDADRRRLRRSRAHVSGRPVIPRIMRFSPRSMPNWWARTTVPFTLERPTHPALWCEARNVGGVEEVDAERGRGGWSRSPRPRREAIELRHPHEPSPIAETVGPFARDCESASYASCLASLCTVGMLRQASVRRIAEACY